MRNRCVGIVRAPPRTRSRPIARVRTCDEAAPSLDRDKHAIRDAHVGCEPTEQMRWGRGEEKLQVVSRRERRAIRRGLHSYAALSGETRHLARRAAR